ncbi:MAG TPA: PEGA domain-containing protein [Kofleriaceae bacterium]|nr:PEGA domain-containing protein [Kofleriaceae bacterium]
MRSLLLALFLVVVGCSGSQRADSDADRAILVIESPVADAVLWVDGRYIAQLRDLRRGVPLPPGHHQIEVRHDRYHAHYAEVDLVKGRQTRLQIDLAEVLP